MVVFLSLNIHEKVDWAQFFFYSVIFCFLVILWCFRVVRWFTKVFMVFSCKNELKIDYYEEKTLS